MLIEVEALLDLPDMVDHPPEGSKDTTDAAAGAYWNAINYEQEAGSPSGTEPAMYPDAAISQGIDEAPPITLPVKPEERRTPVFHA